MKPFEEKLREERTPFTLVLSSGERIRVQMHDHLSIPPTEDDSGNPLADGERADYFQVWGNGLRYRWVAFNALLRLRRRHRRTEQISPLCAKRDASLTWKLTR